MVGAHVGHDCRVGNHCIVVNHVLLGGHVTVEDRAYLGGGVGVHQFCRIGRLAMIGGLSKITQDVPPFVMIDGHHSQVVGLNKVGLRRNGYTPDDVLQLKEAYRVIYRAGPALEEVLAILEEQFTTGPAAVFHEFLKQGKRGFVQERRISRKATLKIVDPDARRHRRLCATRRSSDDRARPRRSGLSVGLSAKAHLADLLPPRLYQPANWRWLA